MRILITVAAMLLTTTACQGPFNLQAALGLSLETLSISPENITLTTTQSQDFTVTGGTGPYDWEVISGPGDFSSATGLATENYGPAGTEGTVLIRVTDANDYVGQVSITIDNGTGPVTILSGSNDVEINTGIRLFATGGDGSYSWFVDTDGSGGASLTGSGDYSDYIAGPDAGVDVIRLIDGQSSIHTININVSDSTAPLALQVGSNTLDIGDSITLYASGGVPPYSFDFETKFIADSAVGLTNGIYTAGTSAGTDILRVTDNVAATSTISITVSDPTPALNLMAGSTSLYTGDVITLFATGGVPPYSFDFITNGTTDSIVTSPGGIYTAGSAIGVDEVRVRDSAGTPDIDSVTINVTVEPVIPADVNYNLSGFTVPANVDAGALITLTDGVSFTYGNIGSGNDTANTVDISVYVSESADLSGNVTKIGEKNGLPGLIGGGLSTIDIDDLAGNWPTEPGNYYIVALISAVTDTDSSNNEGYSPAAVNVLPPDINYIMQIAPAGGGKALVGGDVSLLLDSFVLRNSGTDTGTENLVWEAWASLDGSLSVTDYYLGTNTIIPAAIQGLSDSPLQPITGTWPAVPGDYFILISWESSEDNNGSPIASSALSVPVGYPVTDYRVDLVNVPSPGITGSTVNFSFDVANDSLADDDPNAEFQWEVYASTDDSFSAGDTRVAEGTWPSLNANATATVSGSGFWPDIESDYYLIARVESDNELAGTLADNVLAGASQTEVLSDIDYEITDVQYHPVGTPGALRSVRPDTPLEPTSLVGGSFKISKNSTSVGKLKINWNVFVSDDQALDGTDEPVASGTSYPAEITAGGGFTTVEFTPTGSWPNGYFDTYYYIITIDAVDDGETSNDHYATDPVEVVSVYGEDTENNSAVGPWDEGPPSNDTPPTLVSDAGGILPTGELRVGEVLRIDGVLDASGQFDTYHFLTAEPTTKIHIRLVWNTGADSADYWFWDHVGTNLPYVETTVNEEGPSIITGFLDTIVEDSYIGVEAVADSGATYSLYITGQSD